MRGIKRFVGLALVALIPAGRSSAAPPTKDVPAVDPNAVAALERMGTFLRAQKTFVVKSEGATDDVMESGLKVQVNGSTTLKVRRPDRLRAEVVTDAKNRQFFYDGKTFTMFGPDANYYAQVPAPPTIREVLEEVGKKFGIELPLADLFYWGTDKSGVAEIRSAIDMGPSTVAGTKCDHFAFRQADVDWQIWIQQGDQPLPRKLVLTSVKEPSDPQHQAVLTWTLNPNLDDQVFTFTAPKGAMPITFEEVKAARGRQGKANTTKTGETP